MIEAVFSDMATQDLVVVIDGEEYAVTPDDCEFILECAAAGQVVAIEC